MAKRLHLRRTRYIHTHQLNSLTPLTPFQEFELVELNVRDALTDSSPAADELHFARITRSDPRKEEEDSMMEKDEWERKWLVLYLSFAISSIFIVLG